MRFLLRSRRKFVIFRCSCFFAYITLLTKSLHVDAFNIEISLPTIVSPGVVNASQTSDYFGYSFSFDQISQSNPKKVRMAVGVPKKKQPNDGTIGVSSSLKQEAQEQSGSGEVLSCEVDVSSSTHNCTSLTTPRASAALGSDVVTDRDSLGFNVLSPANSPNLAICAPCRIKKCPTILMGHGVCYNSVDFGQTWINNSKGATPGECPRIALDLIFLLDGSGSIEADEFKTVLEWVVNVSSNFDMKHFAKIGVIQYSAYQGWILNGSLIGQPYLVTEVAIGEFDNVNDFKNALQNVTFHARRTDTARAIRKSVLDFMSSPRFNDSETKKILVLVTDGKASDGYLLEDSSNYARSQGIVIYAVGVGDYVEAELKVVTGTTKNATENDRIYGLTDFSGLNKIVDQLQQAITGNLEGGGSTASNATNSLTQSQSGISGYQDINGAMYLGAVGAYDWSGTVMKYDTANDQSADIPGYDEVQRVLPTRTKESYLGYSVTTGNFNGGNKQFVASGAPRYLLEGAVVIYEAVANNINFANSRTIRAYNANRQLGSYFGGSVFATDVNNDGRPDLFVGASLFTDEAYDEGRVFAYTTDMSSNNHERWAAVSYEPRVLVGQKQAGGRFGTAMASAGDLNKDGYNDIIVGAPFTDVDRGSIFIYHGGRDGINTQVKQRISASEIPGTNLQYFGQSIQGGVDLDENQYPDVAVGAPRSDTVVIFRSRPVARLSATIAFNTAGIDILECYLIPNKQCFTLTACILVDGVEVEDFVDVAFNITLDANKNDKRIEFRTNENSTETRYFEEMVNITKIPKSLLTCFNYNLYVKQTSILNSFSPIIASMTYNLATSHLQRPLSSINDPFIDNKVTAQTMFLTNCGNDGTCNYNLKVESSLILPAVIVKNGIQDLSNNGQRLVVSPHVIVVKFNVSNIGEDAFGVRMTIKYSQGLTANVLESVQRSNTGVGTCVIQNQAEYTSNSNTTERETTFDFNYNNNLGNILTQNQSCSFEFKLSVSELRESGLIDNIFIEIIADTKQGGLANDTNAVDNVWSATRPVFYRSDVQDEKTALPVEVPFNFTEGEERATSITQIGVNTTNIELNYQVDGQGYSNIPLSTLSLTYPDTFIANATGPFHLLYLYYVSCTSALGNAKCNCDLSGVNQYQLTIKFPNENNTNGPSVNISANPGIMRENLFDCSATGNTTSNNVCSTLSCNITNLGDQDSIKITAKFRLWSQSFRLENDTSTILRSEFKYSTAPSTLLFNQNGESVTTLSHIVEVTAKVYTPPVIVIVPDNTWVYIVAAIAGLILLIISVVVMYRLGFFKSKYAEMKQEALEWNNPHQGVNAGSSTAELVND